MLFAVSVRPDLTFDYFGYSPADLVPGSPKPVVVECSGCGLVYQKEFRDSHKRHACPVVKDGKKRCYKCAKWKELAEFNPTKNGSGGVGKLCKVCRSHHPAVQKSVAVQYRRTALSIASSDPTRYLKYRIRHTITKSRSIGLLCDLDYGYMINLWFAQCGLCYYSKLPMCGVAKNGRAVWNSPSIDRLVPSLGYTKNNVVWCVMSVNAFKGDLTESEFKKVLSDARWQTSSVRDSISAENGIDSTLLPVE